MQVINFSKLDPEVLFALFGGYFVFLATGVGALWLSARLRRARHWPSTRGRVLESFEYKDHQGRTHYTVKYEFTVSERIVSETPRACGDWFLTGAHQTAFVARFVPGHEVEVYYDPLDPRQNCLDHQDATGIKALSIFSAMAFASASVVLLLVS